MAQPDDLEAVRTIVSTLEAFEDSDKERILRWVKEKLGMRETSSFGGQFPIMSEALSKVEGEKTDIRTFVAGKNPTNDYEFVATVAYFYQFEAPDSEKKDAIGIHEIEDACRKVPWKQPARITQTLINTEKVGYIDKVSAGKYKINSVGENLVIMVLSGKLERPKIKPQKTKKNAKRSR